MIIQPFDPADFDQFIVYLNKQLAENGKTEHFYFMPFERADSKVGPEKLESFRRALAAPFPNPGWRQLWLACDDDFNIVAHCDLRAHAERHTEHRCVLGIGVNQAYRNRGLGTRLIRHAETWACAQQIQWIDLEVLTVNAPAIRLYEVTGFHQVGEIEAKFALDGAFYSETMMTKKLPL